MARKSQWQQFADNFNSVYGAFNNAAKNIESTRVMNQEFTGDDGAALEGSALDRARYEALANIYTKYGDASAGLGMRAKLAQIESSNRDNDINSQIMDELVAQRGTLQSGLMRANTANASASAANSMSAANERNMLLPGRLEGQGLDNELTGLGVDFGRRTLDDRVDRVGIDNVNAETVAMQNAVDLGTAIRTQDAAVDATNAQNTRAEQSADAQVQAQTVISDLVQKAANMDFDTEADADAWLIKNISRADIMPEFASSTVEAIQNHGTARIGSLAAQLTENARNALRTEGLDGLAELYGSVDDGVNATVERDGNTVRVVVDRGDGMPEILATATGDNAENRVAAQVMGILEDPVSAMAIAAESLNYETAQLNNQRTEALNQLTEAQTNNARIAYRQTAAEIANLGRNPEPGKIEEIGYRGLSSLIGSDWFVELRSRDPEAAEEIRIDFMRQFGLLQNQGLSGGGSGAIPPVPPGVTAADWPTIWNNMSEENRRLFIEE